MSFNTATLFEWEQYALRWTLRAIGVSLLVTFVVGGLGFALTRSGLITSILTSIGLIFGLGIAMLWTVAEMIEDGLEQLT